MNSWSENKQYVLSIHTISYTTDIIFSDKKLN